MYKSYSISAAGSPNRCYCNSLIAVRSTDLQFGNHVGLTQAPDLRICGRLSPDRILAADCGRSGLDRQRCEADIIV